MFGASAMGITANLAAVLNPPHLVANFVMVARSSAYHQALFQGGVFRKELNEIWLKRQNALDTLNETLKHNVYDDYYASNELWKFWQKITVPTYNYGGWYDIFAQGNIDNFVGMQETGAGMALGNQKLIMGPWGHGRIEEVTYPSNAAVNAQDEAMRWFDYWLQGKDNGIMSEPPVRYYVMGDVADPKAPGNEWRTSLDWPAPSRVTPCRVTQSDSESGMSVESITLPPGAGPMPAKLTGESGTAEATVYTSPRAMPPGTVTMPVRVSTW